MKSGGWTAPDQGGGRERQRDDRHVRLTLVLLQLDLAEEVNPFLRWVYEGSPVAFMIAKLALVQLGLLLLWAHRHLLPARIGLRLGAALYAGIILYHAAFVVRLPA